MQIFEWNSSSGRVSQQKQPRYEDGAGRGEKKKKNRGGEENQFSGNH